MEEQQMTVVKTGAPPPLAQQWKSYDWKQAEKEVKRLQMRIAKAVRERQFNKVKALQWLLTSSFSAKMLAVKRVTTNKGSRTPGIDGVVWRSPTARMKGALALRRHGYQAKPLRRITIPKKNGGRRPLGIPTIYDRAMQALYLLALEPVAETTADWNSYGFRPFRACRDATGQCFCDLSKRNSAEWILEGDIKACFDGISHEWLRENVLMDTKLLSQWLSCGYIQDGELFPTRAGTPQGGIISPTLANIALDGMEAAIKAVSRRKDKANFVRYADDFIVTGSRKEFLEEKIIPVIEEFLRPRGLVLSEKKTFITKIEDGFDFLSQNVRKFKGKIRLTPSKDAVKRITQKLRQIFKEHLGRKTEELIVRLNRVIRGWANYHRYIQSWKAFSNIDYVIYCTTQRWMRRRHPNKSVGWSLRKYFRRSKRYSAVFHARPEGCSGEQNTIDLIRMAEIIRVRYIKIKGKSNPYDPAYKCYFTMRSKACNYKPTMSTT
jgi:RNA-directed DNA polymerase